MPEITPDLSDVSRCVSVHWSLPVQCVLPRTHRENWHEAWHPQTGNRVRYRRAARATEELHDGAWHDLHIPGPGVICGEPLSGKSGVFCQMEHGKDGNRWNHFALVNGCRYTWHTPHPRNVTVEQLTQDVKTLRERVAELETEAELVHEYRVPLPDGPGGYAEIVVERNGQTGLWAVTDGSFSGRQAWTPQGEWRFISDIGRAEAYCYSRFDALEVAAEVAEFEAEKRAAAVCAATGGAS